MTILSLPASPKFRTAKFRLISNTQVFRSPLNGGAQTLELPGARWACAVQYPPMQRAEAAAIQAFLVKLRGQAGRFYIGDASAITPRGTATGTPLVNGASQTGGQLITDGWSNGVTGILKAGDYLSFDTSVGRELKLVTADANSDGSGNATFSIEPPLRNSPADNAAITVSSPTCIMMLADPAVEWDTDEALFYGVEFAAEEAFYQ